jgi:uncharacterized protein (TIGR02594 family)
MQRCLLALMKAFVPVALAALATPAMAQSYSHRSDDPAASRIEFEDATARLAQRTKRKGRNHSGVRIRVGSHDDGRRKFPIGGAAVASAEDGARAPEIGWGSSALVAEARRWVGTNPTGRRSLWCARFMNFVLQRAGHAGTGSDMAGAFAGYGRRISEPRVGAIAVMSRGRRGGHVGVVSGIDENGDPIIISGNHNNRVAETAYPRGRIRAYVMPDSRGPAKDTRLASAKSAKTRTR